MLSGHVMPPSPDASCGSVRDSPPAGFGMRKVYYHIDQDFFGYRMSVTNAPMHILVQVVLVYLLSLTE